MKDVEGTEFCVLYIINELAQECNTLSTRKLIFESVCLHQKDMILIIDQWNVLEL